MKEALYYQKDGEKVRCLLCPQDCLIAHGKKGLCGVRTAKDGILYTTNYGKYAAAALDPIEKKPLYHFYPGSQILSLGTIGCNLHCSFCQNWTLARSETRSLQDITPEQVLLTLQKTPQGEGVGVAYTYNEPFVWFEFVLDTAKTLSCQGFRNVLVTNGLVNPKPLQELLPYIDAMNIDVKAFNEGFYRERCRGPIKDVLQTVEKAKDRCHLELTYLVVPTLNDDLKEVESFVQWVAKLDRGIPVHFSRYFPQHKLNLPPTPVATMEKIRDLAKEKLEYVYLGNVGEVQGSSTYCPTCRQLLLERKGYYLHNKGVTGGKKCSKCRAKVKIIGEIFSR